MYEGLKQLLGMKLQGFDNLGQLILATMRELNLQICWV